MRYIRHKMCLSTRWGAAPQVRTSWRPATVAWLLALTTSLSAGAARAEPCKLGRLAELPVTMEDLRPLVHAAIDGRDALFIADSGAFFSVLTPAGAKQFNLRLEPAFGMYMEGVGGDAAIWLTTAKTFTIFGIDLHQIPFYVGGNDLDHGAVGVLGQNVFRIGDVEYDLANGVIRILRTRGDCRKVSLAYWTKAQDLPYSQMDIDFATVEKPHTTGIAYVNGSRIRVMFDSGADTSELTLAAAKRAGITPESPGVTDGGSTYGVGRRVVRSWIGPFASFKVGDEEIRNTRLRFSDMGFTDTDMLIGADFFLSHHVLVASSQRKLYFTYNGGPVFNLLTQEARAQGAAPPPPAAGADAVAPAAAAPAAPAQGERLDAAGYARRGSASASRRDFGRAIADLSRAIELDATQADYFYERGRVYDSTKQTDKALADFSQAIRLKPDDVPALMARVKLQLDQHDPADAVRLDLDAADRAAPKEADMRLDLGDLYQHVRDYRAAIAQYDRWIDSHNRDDIQMARARNARCWVRVLTGLELDRALDDCNAAVRQRPRTAGFIESRGFVYLRQGRFDKAITDYNAALALDPKLHWALYGRGLAKQHLGQAAAAEADIAAATALYPEIAAAAASHGIGQDSK
jgi:tetratricopeptide (TPR) repeat protein/predicted aspartyl protease